VHDLSLCGQRWYPFQILSLLHIDSYSSFSDHMLGRLVLSSSVDDRRRTTAHTSVRATTWAYRPASYANIPKKTTLASNHINLHLTVLRRILLLAVLRWGLDWCLTSYMPSGAFPIGKRRWTLQPCHNSRTSSQQDLTTFTPPRAKHHHLESVSNPRHHDRASSLILSTPTSNPNKSSDMAGGGKGTR
jgi:hypothetical protein